MGVSASVFTINGKPAFLYGISYYGALGAPDRSIEQDLADIKRYKFNWIRVWVNWAGGDTDISAVDDNGYQVNTYMDKLKWLVAQCDRRGIVVDITLAHGNKKDGMSLKTLAAHQQAVRSVISALGSYGNWYLDLANEHDVGDNRYVSFDDLKALRELCKTLKPGLLVTASAGGDISKADLGAYLQKVEVDFISPHRPRTPESAMQTEARTREYIEQMKTYGRVIPVHYQEPFRRGYTNWQPEVKDYVADLNGAIAGGAAGWCFHNGDQRASEGNKPQRSFDMHEQRLFDQLDAVELAAIKVIANRLKR
ncbi:hypothetical protein GCM10022392_29040 [Mucilaginibacter panaciglaebae]|uniref:Cellulase (Glycosyl hydrolase family 5) n=1 Tax=Mucilaginibacter panaciglaebae TaxID=502331 RepID=A0ABP7X1C3_9SPHI